MIPITVVFAAVPLLLRALPYVVPAPYLESYTYWSPSALNDREVNGRVAGWRNMGWWEDTDSFTVANEALARKLLAFADAPAGGNVLDLAHGTGESLLLHLESRPAHLHGLTSLPAESAAARALVAGRAGDTDVEVFVGSASFRPGKDLEHPLNPMRGLMGDRPAASFDEDEDDDDDDRPAENGGEQARFAVKVAGDDDTADSLDTSPPPYDLIYILDAIYHFPPSVPDFLSSARHVARPGGVVAFTDILPPPSLPPLLSFFLPRLLAVPRKNIQRRPASLEAYAAMLEHLGYEDVRVEDWTQGVVPGLRGFLEKKGGAWAWAAKVFAKAERDGWKFVAVRARRPVKS
ncbi:hypothetical protein Q5752_004490 [Cryptotrichosporon argae]